jgi:hypothetical protein
MRRADSKRLLRKRVISSVFGTHNVGDAAADSRLAPLLVNTHRRPQSLGHQPDCGVGVGNVEMDRLQAWQRCRRTHLNRLMPVVYDELRRAARNYMRRGQADHNLQAASLVHEV